MKKRLIVAAVLTALAVGGIGVAVAGDKGGGGTESATAVPIEPREQGQLPAPPRPARQKPIERVVTTVRK